MENNLYFEKAQKLQCTFLGKIAGDQGGAIYNDCIFRFDGQGHCRVFDLQTLQEKAQFTLDKAELLVPHSNAVCFGAQRWEETDEFPVLYTNIYNNYCNQPDRKEGVCCVYRIIRNGDGFTTQLVQVIQIAFVHDGAYWCSENGEDVRPYGNFVVDAEAKKLHAFVMRDQTQTTRFFRFALPKLTEGVFDAQLGANVVLLETDEIEQQFDSVYVHYMQGACCYKGMIYSVEGFNYPSVSENPAIRIFDTEQKKVVFEAELAPYGMTIEPEMIEVYNNQVYYSDNDGAMYLFRFAD